MTLDKPVLEGVLDLFGVADLPLISAIRLISISLIRFSERVSLGFAVDFLLTQRCKRLAT